MRRIYTKRASIVLWAAAWMAPIALQSQTTDSQPPESPGTSRPSQMPASPETQTPPSPSEPRPETPVLPAAEPVIDKPADAPPAEPQAEKPPTPAQPLVWTPPPPPAVKKPKEKVIIDSRGRRVRSAKGQGNGSRATDAPKQTLRGDTQFKIRSDVELVLLDVSVKDSKGGFVSGLPKENFKVFEDKNEQEITVFQAQDVPVTVGLVVDNSGSVRPKKHLIVTAALTFVKNSNPQDEVFIVNFNDRVLKGLPAGVDFTDDHTVLRDALLVNPAQGRTALYDGLMEALDHLEKGRLDKKTLILVADGGDNMSDTTREEIIRRVQESLATIYTVGIFNPHDKDKDPGFLKELAEISGGQYYRPENINHLVGVCEKIAHDIRNRYTIGYTPKNLTFDGKVRKLRILATNPADGRKLEVRTRTQYQTPTLEDSASR